LASTEEEEEEEGGGGVVAAAAFVVERLNQKLHQTKIFGWTFYIFKK